MPFFIVTGKKGEGKTYLVEKFSELILKEGLSVGGFITKGQENRSFVDLKTRKEETFWKKGDTLKEEIGNFKISKRALSFVEEVLDKIGNEDLIVIDEIGWLEAEKKCLHEIIVAFLDRENREIEKNVILVVRRQIVEKITDLYGVKIQQIWFYERQKHQQILSDMYRTMIENHL